MSSSILHRRMDYYTPVWNTLVNDFCDFIPTYGTIRQYGIHFLMTFAILYRRIVYYTPVWNTLFNDFRDFIPTYRTIRQYGIHCFPLFTVKTFLHTDVNFRHFLSKETIMLLEDKYYEMII